MKGTFKCDAVVWLLVQVLKSLTKYYFRRTNLLTTQHTTRLWHTLFPLCKRTCFSCRDRRWHGTWVCLWPQTELSWLHCSVCLSCVNVPLFALIFKKHFTVSLGKVCWLFAFIKNNVMLLSASTIWNGWRPGSFFPSSMLLVRQMMWRS